MNLPLTEEEQKKYDLIKALIEKAKIAMEDELNKALEKAELEWIKERETK